MKTMDYDEADLDKETGELKPKLTLNVETGEEEYINYCPEWRTRKKHFKIPSEYFSNTSKIDNDKIKNKIPIKANPSKGTAALIFLLPSLLFYYPPFLFFIMIIEVLIHIWAHKKNRSLKTEEIYYESPLHIIWSEFCGLCVEEQIKTKIGKIHDKQNFKIRNDRLQYVKSVVT